MRGKCLKKSNPTFGISCCSRALIYTNNNKIPKVKNVLTENIYQITLQSLNFSFIIYIQLSNNIKFIQIRKKVGTRNLLLINCTDIWPSLCDLLRSMRIKNASYSKIFQRTHFQYTCAGFLLNVCHFRI